MVTVGDRVRYQHEDLEVLGTLFAEVTFVHSETEVGLLVEYPTGLLDIARCVKSEVELGALGSEGCWAI